MGAAPPSPSLSVRRAPPGGRRLLPRLRRASSPPSLRRRAASVASAFASFPHPPAGPVDSPWARASAGGLYHVGCGAGASCQRGALPPEEGCRRRPSLQPRGGVGVAPTKISHGCALSQNKVSSEFNEGALVESTVRGVWARRALPLGPGLPPPGPVLWQRWGGGLPSDRWHGDRAGNGHAARYCPGVAAPGSGVLS